MNASFKSSSETYEGRFDTTIDVRAFDIGGGLTDGEGVRRNIPKGNK